MVRKGVPKGKRTPGLSRFVDAARAALRKLDSAVHTLIREMGGVGDQPKRTLNLSRVRRAELKLQGAYLGYMRQLKPAQKAEVRAIRAKRGVRPAIIAAKRLAAAKQRARLRT